MNTTSEASAPIIGYARVSSAEQARSGLGLEAQQSALVACASANGYVDRIELVNEKGLSGTIEPTNRPVLGPAIERLDEAGDGVLVVSRLDRVGRSALDVLSIVERAKRGGWSIVMLDLVPDSGAPAGAIMLTMLAALEQLEREIIAQRTSDALEALKARGERLGAPVSDATRAAGVRAGELQSDGAKPSGDRCATNCRRSKPQRWRRLVG